LNSNQVLSARGRKGLRAAVVAAVAAAIALTVFAPLGSAAPRDPQPQVTLSPGTLTFPDRPVGTRTEAQAVTLTNTGDAPLTISTFRLNGPDAGDFGLGALCPVNPDQLQPGASCTIYVSFTPDSPGPKSATLAIGDDAPSSPQTVELTGFGDEASGGTPAATVSTETMGFGDEIVDTRSYAQSVTVTNSGTAPLTISTFRLTGPDAVDFAQGADCPVNPDPLPVGSSCMIYVSFDPDSGGWKSANLVIGDDAPDHTQTVALSGRGSLGAAEATVAPGAITFADRMVGTTSDAQAVTVRNTGAEPLAISTFRLNGADAADFAQGADCPVSPDTLLPGGSCTIYVSFTPHSGGQKSASLVIGDSAPSSPQTVLLSGRGLSAPVVSLAPSALTFRSQTLATSSPTQSISLSNTGGGPLVLGSVDIDGPDAADFSQTNDCPASLNAGASCSVAVTFTPSAEGPRSATLTLNDNADDSPQAVSLFGAGVAAGTYFADDFESGSLAQWNVLTSADSTVSLDSTVAHSGTTSVRVTNRSGDQASRLYADLAGGGHAQTYTHFCFNISAGHTEGIEIANGRAITDEYPLGIRRWVITWNPVTKGLEGYFFNEALDRLDLYAASGQVLTGEWHCADLYLDERVAGSAELWLDGVSVGSVHGDLGTPSPYDRVYLWNQPAAGSVWFDDVKVASTPFGS
jgi:hypothetical protein